MFRTVEQEAHRFRHDDDRVPLYRRVSGGIVATMIRAVILSLARTGSNLLLDMLNQHPSLYFHGEIFNSTRVNGFRAYEAFRQANGIDPTAFRDSDHRRFMEAVFTDYHGSEAVRASGFKLFLNHSPSILQHVAAHPDYRLVVLERANRLASYSSKLIGEATGIWSSKFGSVPEGLKVAFDAEGFDGFRRFSDAAYGALRQRLKDRPNVFEIEYTALSDDAKVAALVEFLGATADRPLVPSLKKQNSTDIVGRFDNPDEVRTYLTRHNLLPWATE